MHGGTHLQSQHIGDGNRRIPGAQWPASPAEHQVQKEILSPTLQMQWRASEGGGGKKNKKTRTQA